MATKSMDMAWIVVKNLKKAVQFYTEVVGLKLMEMHEQFGWAELQGTQGGARLGIAQERSQDNSVPSGANAVVTFTVDNIELARDDFLKRGAQCIGDIQEVPGHVKLQMVRDTDGNQFQLAELFGE